MKKKRRHRRCIFCHKVAVENGKCRDHADKKIFKSFKPKYQRNAENMGIKVTHTGENENFR
jgi:hypothetical protein